LISPEGNQQDRSREPESYLLAYDL